MHSLSDYSMSDFFITQALNILFAVSKEGSVENSTSCYSLFASQALNRFYFRHSFEEVLTCILNLFESYYISWRSMATQSRLATRRDAPPLALIKTTFTVTATPLKSPSQSSVSPGRQILTRSASSNEITPQDTSNRACKAPKSKSSVFGLFGRSAATRAPEQQTASTNVPRQRHEGALAPQRAVPHRHHGDLRSAMKKSDPRDASCEAAPTKVKSVTIQAPNNATSKQASFDARYATPWEPPALLQVYSQAIRHCRLEAPHSPQGHKMKERKVRDTDVVAEQDISLRRRSSFLRTKASSSSISSQVNQPPKGRNEGQKARKIYVLVATGYLLQYAAEGSSGRKPEKILKLGSKCAAFASDLIPGKHFVLRVVQSTVEVDGVPRPPRKSLMSRLGMSNPIGSRSNSDNILMVFERPEDMNKWMISIRREIEQLAGKSCLSPTKDARAKHGKGSPTSYGFLTAANVPLPCSGQTSPVKSGASSPSFAASDCNKSGTGAWTDCSSQDSATAALPSYQGRRVNMHQHIAANRTAELRDSNSKGALRRSDRTSRLVAQLPTPPGTGTKLSFDDHDISELFRLVDHSIVADSETSPDFVMNVLGWRPPKVPVLPPMSEQASQDEDQSTLHVTQLPLQDDAYDEATPPLTGNSLLSQFPVAKGSLESSASRSKYEDQPSPTLGVEIPKSIQKVLANSKPKAQNELAHSDGTCRQVTGEQQVSHDAEEDCKDVDVSRTPASNASSARSSTLFRASTLQPLQLVSASEPSSRRSSNQLTDLPFPSKRMLRANAPLPLLPVEPSVSASNALSNQENERTRQHTSQPSSPTLTALHRRLGKPASLAPPPSPATPRTLARPASIRIRPSQASFVAEREQGLPSPRLPFQAKDSEDKRNSTLVPIVRPGFVKAGSSSRVATLSLNLPPMQPPSGESLPILPHSLSVQVA